MAKDESIQQAGKDRAGSVPRESPILNHRLREDGETFWDAMRQGEAALYGAAERTEAK